MSIWISKPARLICGAALAVLAGCDDLPTTGEARAPVMRGAPDTIAVANKSIVIGGPTGYCIDRGASRLGGATAFVLLGSCASISGDPAAGAPEVPGLLTASVDKQPGATSDNLAALDQFEALAGSQTGRAALARDGRADSVTVFGTLREKGALFIQLRDTSANALDGLESTYWRGLFDLNGRLITVSVVGFANRPLGAGEGLFKLRGFVDRIRSETPQPIVASLDGNNPSNPPQKRKKLFPGLFN